MFGTVTSGMIADQLKTQFEISLDKRKIHLEHAIRTLGEHEVELRLHPDVTTTLKVRVESTTPPPVPVEAPAAPEDKKEGARTEKRGRRQETAGTAEGGENKAKGGKAERPQRAERAPRTERAPRQEKPGKSAKQE